MCHDVCAWAVMGAMMLLKIYSNHATAYTNAVVVCVTPKRCSFELALATQ
jgi:hypothetical protein